MAPAARWEARGSWGAAWARTRSNRPCKEAKGLYRARRASMVWYSPVRLPCTPARHAISHAMHALGQNQGLLLANCTRDDDVCHKLSISHDTGFSFAVTASLARLHPADKPASRKCKSVIKTRHATSDLPPIFHASEDTSKPERLFITGNNLSHWTKLPQ